MRRGQEPRSGTFCSFTETMPRAEWAVSGDAQVPTVVVASSAALRFEGTSQGLPHPSFFLFGFWKALKAEVSLLSICHRSLLDPLLSSSPCPWSRDSLALYLAQGRRVGELATLRFRAYTLVPRQAL